MDASIETISESKIKAQNVNVFMLKNRRFLAFHWILMTSLLRLSLGLQVAANLRFYVVLIE